MTKDRDDALAIIQVISDAEHVGLGNMMHAAHAVAMLIKIGLLKEASPDDDYQLSVNLELWSSVSMDLSDVQERQLREFLEGATSTSFTDDEVAILTMKHLHS